MQEEGNLHWKLKGKIITNEGDADRSCRISVLVDFKTLLDDALSSPW